MAQQKQNVSVRMSSTDLSKLKKIAHRLDVKETDLFRFAVKSLLSKLIPLHDYEVRGVDLVPAFMEYGEELSRHFELDAKRLEAILNDGVESLQRRVAREDLELIALAGLNENYVVIKLSEHYGRSIPPERASEALREYLYEKYISAEAREGFYNGDGLDQSLAEKPVS